MHKWKFFSAGGFYQVRLESGADLLALRELDQKLWVALACPTKGIEFDQRTLELIDVDKDGRIRAPEFIEAVEWAGARLKNADVLVDGADALALSAIDDTHAEGKALLEAANTILEGLGDPNSNTLSVAQMQEAMRAFAQMPFNGDGVVPPESASDPEVAEALADIVATQGGVADRSGRAGVDADTVARFYADAQANAAWLAEARDNAALLPLGATTNAAVEAYSTVRAKIDDYFARCRLVAFDARAQSTINGEEGAYVALTSDAMTLDAHELDAFPLAQISGGRPLPLGAGLNPAWTARVRAFRQEIVIPLLGDVETLDEAQWLDVRERMAPHLAWQGRKAGASVEALGEAKIQAYAEGKAREAIEALLAADAAKTPVAEGIEAVERLVRYNRDLMRLANNFVSFSEFYGRKDKAVFQAGRLYLDQRSCDLVMRVDDAARHATLAPLSRAYLVYCDCVRSGGEKMTIVAAITAGDVDNLMVGRNGVFYDRDGNDWDATVTRIVDNPISLRQAFWSPYKKVARFVEDQINKRAAEAEKAGEDRVMGAATELDGAASGSKTDAKPAPKKFDIGVLAAIGVAVGGVTAALGAMLQAFFGLGLWMPLGVVGLLVLVSGPSMLLAWLKLRQRNLGPLLDANGWAVNALARINVPFGGSLTTVAALPAGAARELADPFAEKRAPVKTVAAAAAALILAVLWFAGNLDGILPARLRQASVLGKTELQVPPSDAPTEPPSEAAAE